MTTHRRTVAQLAELVGDITLAATPAGRTELANRLRDVIANGFSSDVARKAFFAKQGGGTGYSAAPRPMPPMTTPATTAPRLMQLATAGSMQARPTGTIQTRPITPIQQDHTGRPIPAQPIAGYPATTPPAQTSAPATPETQRAERVRKALETITATKAKRAATPAEPPRRATPTTPINSAAPARTLIENPRHGAAASQVAAAAPPISYGDDARTVPRTTEPAPTPPVQIPRTVSGGTPPTTTTQSGGGTYTRTPRVGNPAHIPYGNDGIGAAISSIWAGPKTPGPKKQTKNFPTPKGTPPKRTPINNRTKAAHDFLTQTGAQP